MQRGLGEQDVTAFQERQHGISDCYLRNRNGKEKLINRVESIEAWQLVRSEA